MLENRSHTLAFAGMVAVGFALRAWGIGFGLPLESNLYVRPDESLVVHSAVRLFENQGHPGLFVYPAFLIEICALLFAAVLWPFRLAAHWSMTEHFGHDPSMYFLAARWTSVVAGTATIGVVWRIGERLGGRRAAWSSALLFACAPLSIRDAHFAVTDTLLTLLVALAGAEALRTCDHETPSLRLGLWSGLSLATKYTSLVFAPVLAWSARRRPVATAAVVLAAYAATNPYALFFPRQAGGSVYEVLSVFYVDHAGARPWTLADAFQQVWNPLHYGPGGIAGLALAAGALLWGLWGRRGTLGVRLLLAAAIPVCLVGALVPFRHWVPYRYLLPAFPWVAVLAGAALSRWARAAWIAATVTVALALPGAWTAARLDALLSREDTRTLAGQWLARHVPTGTPVVYAGGAECEPQLRESATSIQRRIELVNRLYGKRSGELIAGPYRLMLGAAGPGGAEVFRNPSPEGIPGPEFFVVVPRYPLSMCASTGAWRTPGDRVDEVYRIAGLRDPSVAIELGNIDAFFLPFRPLEAVERPGPDFTVYRVRRAGKPAL